MKSLIKYSAIIMAVMLLSCERANQNSSTIQDEKTDERSGEVAGAGAAASADSTAVADEPKAAVLQAGQPPLSVDWDKKIIKTANITVELKDYNSFNSIIHNNTRRYGAYISNEQQNQSDGKIENVISIKVPVDRFEELINALPAEGVKMIEKRISSEDVTGEIVDTKARVEARKQVRERYLGLLKQAKTMKEILGVEKEVNSIQEDIEAGSGRVELLRHQSAYSTVNLTYYQYLVTGDSKENEPLTFSIKLKTAFQEGGEIVTGLLIILTTLWPFLIAGLLVFYLVKRHAAKATTVVKRQL